MNGLELVPGIRVSLADALSTIDGVKVSPIYRQVSRPGEGVVRFDGAIRDVTGFGWIVTLQALILVPQEVPRAEAWIDTTLEPLVSAAATEILVTSADPVQLQLDAGLLPALQIIGTRAV